MTKGSGDGEFALANTTRLLCSIEVEFTVFPAGNYFSCIHFDG